MPGNKHGLNRDIPAPVRREIRQRSKFACVICRNGFYQFEHIDPEFQNALIHDPAAMCCLCGSCHDRVTRKQLSKDTVKRAYAHTQAASAEEVGPPVGPLDYHQDEAELVIGGLSYRPAVHSILRYYGVDVFTIVPGQPGQPASISAIFTDDAGNETLRLQENEWVGSLSAWDTEVDGPRLTVRRRARHVVLQVRLDPPSRIVIERLDMRIGDAHLMVSEQHYAVGRYVADRVHWASAVLTVMGSDSRGVAIEVDSVEEISRRGAVQTTGSSMATDDGAIALIGGVGALVKPLGISIGSFCSFALRDFWIVPARLQVMRNLFFTRPEAIPGRLFELQNK